MSLDLPVKRFNFFVPITKAVANDEGDWVVEGPLSNPEEDLQGEKMSMEGLKKGLKVFEKLGRNVDWEHLYRQTKDPKYLIGKGVAMFDAPHPRTGEMVPWLRTKLLKSKAFARSAIEHLHALQDDCGESGGLGYSVEGGAVKRYGSTILEPIITMVTMTPQPVVAENSGTISIVKSLTALDNGADWDEVDLIQAPEMICPISDEAFRRDFEVTLKAMEATGATPREGPGANALETEGLEDKKLCSICEREDCKCEMLEKALAFQLGEELACFC